MSEEVQVHATSTLMVQSVPPQVDAGINIALKVRVSCPHACDLQGKTVRVLAQDGALVKEMVLGAFQEESNETDEFPVQVPIELGEYTWSVVFPAQEIGEILHESSSTPVKFDVKPHKISIAVWDFPSPAIMNSQFQIKVGVKCSAECQLKGMEVEVYDGKGTPVATGTLGETPWPQTSGLYWTEAKLIAPAKEDVYSWSVKFPATGSELPHEEASTSLYFRTAKPPEHVVTVQVIDKDFKTPVKNADILLNTYRTFTDEYGIAKVEVPKGAHEFYVSAHNYEIYQGQVEIAGDVNINVELVPAPF